MKHFVHDHQPVSVQNEQVNGAPVTFVLFRCAGCGDVYSEELDGTWTIDQIQGKTREAR